MWWEGSATYLSLVSKLPKKVIPKKIFASGCPNAKPHTLKNKGSAITIGTFLILDIHAIINRQLLKQGIRRAQDSL